MEPFLIYNHKMEQMTNCKRCCSKEQWRRKLSRKKYVSVVHQYINVVPPLNWYLMYIKTILGKYYGQQTTDTQRQAQHTQAAMPTPPATFKMSTRWPSVSGLLALAVEMNWESASLTRFCCFVFVNPQNQMSNKVLYNV